MKLSEVFGFLEMNASYYLSDLELESLYWDRINVSYSRENYKNYSNSEDDESFPMAMSQLLCNSLVYLKNPIFSSMANADLFAGNKNHFDHITFLIIENGYDNILPNLFKKIMKIPNILKGFNINQIKSIFLLIWIYSILIIILCIINFVLFHYTNKSIIDGMEKVSKIKLEKIEEIIKRIKLFNNILKKFRDKDIKPEDKSELIDDDSKIRSENKSDNNDKNKKKNDQELSLINSNGFNIDNKRYIPLNILRYIFIYSFFIILFIIICIIMIYIYSYKMVINSNKLLIVENYIFGKLIAASTSIIEIKCFISECRNKTKINYDQLVDYNIIQEVIKGLNLFSKISYFYNEQFLLNACGAAINNITHPDEYSSCLEDSTIMTANNTENILKYIDDLIANLQKEFEINNKTNNNYERRNLFNQTNYKDIEKIFFKYIMGVDDTFVNSLLVDLEIFLLQKQLLVIIIMVTFALLVIIYCIVYRIFLIKKLIHYLTVSRCILRIIPTSIILSTPELEGWIENKY